MEELRKKNNSLNVVDRKLPTKGFHNKVSLSAFSLLFSELIQYTHRRVHNVKDFERRLADIGYNVGLRLLEYISWKEKATKRETEFERILHFISNTVWKMLFGKNARPEKSKQVAGRYMITEDETLVNKFISVPKDLAGLSCGSFVGGIVEGILYASEFLAKVTTHSVQVPENPRFPRTVILIELDKEVFEREAPQDG
eukprot:TRINITY_DN14970_c0_g1_i1.p1 TRINITY_DN14970_c0_g1~~TRINITY_DN14970_c0_g1_i1.p1  ORF type:complete len:198 (-),score=30.85 TRINITY_DN14970_c0_g1_i1:68-661(-)